MTLEPGKRYESVGPYGLVIEVEAIEDGWYATKQIEGQRVSNVVMFGCERYWREVPAPPETWPIVEHEPERIPDIPAELGLF